MVLISFSWKKKKKRLSIYIFGHRNIWKATVISLKQNMMCRDRSVSHHSEGQSLKLPQVTIIWSLLRTNLVRELLSAALNLLHIHGNVTVGVNGVQRALRWNRIHVTRITRKACDWSIPNPIPLPLSTLHVPWINKALVSQLSLCLHQLCLQTCQLHMNEKLRLTFRQWYEKGFAYFNLTTNGLAYFNLKPRIPSKNQKYFSYFSLKPKGLA